ncbi:MAG: M28 family peptidase, partial [Planctomycetes bacterium]|nr:M28 family peptidase [Planctomycetota bacterium]
MNSIGLILWILCTFGSGAALEVTDPPGLVVALETIDAEDLYLTIDFLASDALYGRNAGTAGNQRAVEWIADRFQKMGLKPAGVDGSYFQPFTFRPRGTSGTKAKASNVAAYLEGSDPELKKEVVIVGAHLDHVGRKGHEADPGRLGKGMEGDYIWNGADDNASGTSAVLEIAQAFSFCKRKP